MISNSMITPVGLVPNVSTLQTKTTPAEATESFASYLKSAIDSVAAQEQNVHKVNDQFLIGEVDENKVIIAATQAELSLTLVGQVRNKVIEAYQEIMRIQV
ncbi:flagellar hook-basal body complex protein FliE [Cohnella cholangitidis]|uniref:Flagellar hook-basal body complex protein FliE n=1 Tax=Cohnella cholangitidis TaxID=2598458 RepID=A0A7G5BT90_9BACL|nr:flagellar hook-basal body complex protein FliE [Cohnella cholangitidis]QMV40174.1 flagellar hook-basal body complex protein FliE [Cohnella cholangitidis]